ncbi:MAG: restriction endonuclease [Halobacteriota archaeon]
MLDLVFKICMAHFLCEYSPTARTRKTVDLVREIASSHFSPDLVNEFVSLRLEAFQEALVEEFNARFAEARPIRFQIADAKGIGATVRGYRPPPVRQAVHFQNALNGLTANEFEKLSPVVLRRLGCTEVFFTPTSHDQGVDAFGYRHLVVARGLEVTHPLVWIAQAKHYKSTAVSTGDLRELVGSKELVVAKVFSTVDKRYAELELKAYSPSALILITSEEIPSSVRRLAVRAGIFIYSAFDLRHLLEPDLARTTTRALRNLIQIEQRSIATLR